jgi:hypothetical protein
MDLDKVPSKALPLCRPVMFYDLFTDSDLVRSRYDFQALKKGVVLNFSALISLKG